MNIENETRLSRNIGALTAEQSAMLSGKRVFILGCGGLGGYAAELLTRAGVGAFTVCDSDVFSPSNLNRQLLCLESNLGTGKAEAARGRILAINSGANVTVFDCPAGDENITNMLTGCDLAIDATDNIPARLSLAGGCARAGIYMIHGAISAWSLQAGVIPPGSGMMERLYASAVTGTKPQPVLSFVPAMCASIQAAEAINLLCGRGSRLWGRLAVFDFEDMTYNVVDMT